MKSSTRRDFFAASTVGFIGLVSAAAKRAWGGELQVDDALLYVGTYTVGTGSEGIYLLHLDTRSGELRRIRSVNAGANPSFLAIHPNGRALYTVNEVTEHRGKRTGAVTAFAIAAETGTLTRLNERLSEGGDPCYVSVDRGGRVVLVANYVGGSVALLPIQSDGALRPATTVVQYHGSGPNAQRQAGPHAHCIVADPSSRFALVADLGLDRVVAHGLSLDDKTLREPRDGGASMRPGAGPRHLVFHPSLPLVFVVNELDSTITALRFDNENGTLSPLQTRSTLPADWTGTNYPADIHIAPSGHTLYVSNRGHNSIAVFSVAPTSGALALEQVVPTGGDWPRNFSLDPTGRWLLVANQRSDSIVVFALEQESGRLTPTQQRIALPSPVCLRFRLATPSI